jgi:2-iminobutanoate/2-iminopropanoate deaminase
MRRLLAFAAVLAVAAELRPVYPPNVKPVGPYTPGILAGDYLYVSGQGALIPGRGIISGLDRQTAQCLENIKEVVTAAGLTMEHIVYTQVYMTDITRYMEMNQVYASYFPTDPPARAVIGVTRMPLDTPVEISAVAVRDLTHKKLLTVRGVARRNGVSPLVFTPGRVYISGVLGRYADSNRMPDTADEQVKLAIDNFKLLVKTAKHKADDVTVATVYVNDNVPPDILERRLRKELPQAITVRTASIPFRSNVEITGIIANDLQVRNGTGTTEKVLSGFGALRAALVSNVYVDSIDNFASMNKSYASFFGPVPPTRTTVQPMPVGEAKENQLTVLSSR